MQHNTNVALILKNCRKLLVSVINVKLFTVTAYLVAKKGEVKQGPIENWHSQGTYCLYWNLNLAKSLIPHIYSRIFYIRKLEEWKPERFKCYKTMKNSLKFQVIVLESCQKMRASRKLSFVRTAKITVLFYALSYYHLYVEDWVSKYLFTYPGGAWGEVLLIPDLVENAHEIT